MNLRAIVAVVVAALVWAVTMPALVLLLALFWPALYEAVQIYQQQGGFDMFDNGTLVAFQFLWPLTNLLTGLVAVSISKRQLEVQLVAGLLTVYFAYNHWWAFWVDFPVWYNVIVVILVAPMVLLGGRLPGLVKGGREQPS